MLSFTQLASHYAEHYAPPVTRVKATVNRKTEYGLLQKTLDTYKGALQGKGWHPAEHVARMVGTDRYTANGVLMRMLRARLVELDDSGKNASGRPLYMWRWAE